VLAIVLGMILAAQAKPAPPDAAAQKAAEKLIRDVFKSEFAKRTPADRAALAKKLLAQSAESDADPASRFVLLREARDLAREGADWETAQRAIDETDAAFQVDALPMKAALYTAMGAAAKKPEEWTVLARKQLELADQAADQPELASKALAEAGALAKKAKDMALAAKADAKIKEAAERRGALAKVAKAAETLGRAPDDAEANLIVGRHESLVKGNWEKGLIHLAKGSEPGLKAAASRDLAQPADSAGRIAAGDGWWDLAEKETSARVNLRLRAVYWYEQAAESATGLLKSKIDLRINEARFDRFPGTWVDRTNPSLYGIIGTKLGDPIVLATEPDTTLGADLDSPLTGSWDVVTVRIRFRKVATGAAGLWFERDLGVAVLPNLQVASFITKEGGKYHHARPTVPIVAKADYFLIVALSDGDYIYYLDGKEIARRPTKSTTITNLRLEVEGTEASFEQLKLRKK
jgi:hypothetical protein